MAELKPYFESVALALSTLNGIKFCCIPHENSTVENYGHGPGPSKITATIICTVHGKYGPHAY